MGLGPLHPGREGRGREWREGWGRRVGRGMGRKGRGEEINIHGLKLVAPPMCSYHL